MEAKKSGEFIYSSSNTSLLEFLLTINIIKNKHNLSDAAINEILNVFHCVLPIGNKVPKNLNSLVKKAINDQDGEHLKVCTQCLATKTIGSLKTLKLSSEECDAPECKQMLTSFKKLNLILY
jgi:hypothetical protein